MSDKIIGYDKNYTTVVPEISLKISADEYECLEMHPAYEESSFYIIYVVIFISKLFLLY